MKALRPAGGFQPGAARTWGVRVVAIFLVSAVVAAPAAFGWAMATTRVVQMVGVTPTTFGLSAAGQSELRLGIAGTVFVPRSHGPLGLVATVDGPADPETGSTDLASYASPRMLELYTGLFHDPDKAISGYLQVLERAFVHRLLVAELVLASAGTALTFLVRLLLAGSLAAGSLKSVPDRWRRAAVLIGTLLAASVGLGVVQVHAADAQSSPGRFALPALDGTAADGSTTNSPLLRLVLGNAVPKVQQLVARQERAVTRYLDVAGADLQRQSGAMVGPGDGEIAVMMESDMHCNTTMIRLQRQVMSMLHQKFGSDIPSAMAITGDLTTNGTAAEGSCIKDEAAIAGNVPVAAVTGNHESAISARQMRDAGMQVLDGDRADIGGVDVLGAGDPSRSEFFGATQLRGTTTEADVGRTLYDDAERERTDLVLVHEAYAAQAFIGTHGMRRFLDARGSATVPYDDGVRDLPAAAVLYGHWHRDVEPRVVWNSDGTWTLVMELNTSGGAVDQPTVGHFSTPWTTPQQEASFPVLFTDRDSGLVTGYQLYRFAVDGTAEVEPRVDVGDATDLAGAIVRR